MTDRWHVGFDPGSPEGDRTVYARRDETGTWHVLPAPPDPDPLDVVDWRIGPPPGRPTVAVLVLLATALAALVALYLVTHGGIQ